MSREETLLGLLTAYGGALRRIARTYAGARGEEEDLHQEILLQLWRGLATFRGDSALGTWLYRVALNTALTWRRRAGRDARADSASGRLPAETAGARQEGPHRRGLAPGEVGADALVPAGDQRTGWSSRLFFEEASEELAIDLVLGAHRLLELPEERRARERDRYAS